MKWQYSENCSQTDAWVDISGSNLLSYNPAGLQKTTCFRRVAMDSCQNIAYSNISIFTISPDATIQILANKTVVSENDSVNLSAQISGGVLPCSLSWQKNEVSSSSTNWITFSTDSLQNIKNESTVSGKKIYYRAVYNCTLSSCNIAYSNVITIDFQKQTSADTTGIKIAIAINTQPINQTNCAGNTVNFQVAATGQNLSYQWQRRKPTEMEFTTIDSSFVHVSGFQTANLKISSVGDANNPNQSYYRCQISDGSQLLFSDSVKLNLNGAIGSFGNSYVCSGNSLELDLSKSHEITGLPLSYNWQTRIGTGDTWTDLIDIPFEVSGATTNFLKVENFNKTMQYRCKIVFNSSTGTCNEYTDLMTATLSEFPTKPNDLSFEFCQNVSSAKLGITAGTGTSIRWYSALNATSFSTTQPNIATENAGTYSIYYSIINAGKCESERAQILIQINNKPEVPINTTPSLAYDDSISTLSALGNDLKWYKTATTKTFSSTAPQFHKAGKYTYYVTQTTSKGCESNRMLISLEIFPQFGIVSQPQNQSNCLGNTVTFSLKTKGLETSSFQWEKLNMSKFDAIPNATTKDLKISNVGDSLNPHLSRYRCEILHNGVLYFSDTVTLWVNEILDKATDIVKCEGDSVNWDATGIKFQGQISSVEWQKKTGSTYTTVFTQNKNLSSFKVDTLSADLYKLRVIFQNTTSTCIRYTDNFSLKVNSIPKPLILDTLMVCQNESFWAIQHKLGDKTIWFANEFPNDTLKDMDTQLPLVKKIGYQLISDDGCKSGLSSIILNVRPAPHLDSVNFDKTVCLFDTTLAFSSNYQWFWSESDSIAQKYKPKINFKQSGLQSSFVAFSDEFGCQSPKLKVDFDVIPCYLKAKSDTCFWMNKMAEDGRNSQFFTNNDFKIGLELYAENPNLSNFLVQTRLKTDSSITDLYKNSFYPRYFHISNSDANIQPYHLRFYMHQSEIKPDASLEVVLVNYNGINQDCDLENNIVNDNYCVVDSSHWQKKSNSEFYFVDFKSANLGEFGLWSNAIPNAKITSETNADKKIDLKIISDKRFNSGNFEIFKSMDLKHWTFFKDLNASNLDLNALDLFPATAMNYYKLIYDYGDKIKVKLNVTAQSLDEEIQSCSVYPRPISENNLVQFYFLNAQKSTFKVSDMLGQNFQIKSIHDLNGTNLVKLESPLSYGIYFISALNSAGQKCVSRFWVK